jgi:hypothetical protein
MEPEQPARRLSQPSCEMMVTGGRPVDSTAVLAENGHVDLIVLGLTDSSQWLGTRPGSIAYGVVPLANAPVLVVPPGSSLSRANREAS